MTKLECVGCVKCANDGSEVCGMWWKCAPRYLINYIHLYTFMCRQCANDVQMTKMICVGCVRCVRIYGDVQMMKMECAGCGGGAPLGICSFVCEGWRGALRDLFIYVFYCWWVYFMCW